MENKKVKELKMEEMEQISGGVGRVVNTGIPDLDAAIHIEPRKSSKQIGHVANGTLVDTVTDLLIFDPEAKRHYVQVCYNGRYGYIASSILGMPR